MAEDPGCTNVPGESTGLSQPAPPRPPRGAVWLAGRLSRFVDPEDPLGDLNEVYAHLAVISGARRAGAWYRIQLLRLLPLVLKNLIYWSIMMWKNYLKITWRTMCRRKGYTFINIIGLALGVACFVLIGLYVQDELSYDRYHTQADRIQRVGVRILNQGVLFHAGQAAAPMAAALRRDYPEVESAARLLRAGAPVLRYKDRVFSEERWFYADPEILGIFTIPFRQGEPATALERPGTVLLTESMARKYFGAENPLGKTLRADNRRDYEVTGVVADVPANSHVHYDFLVSMKSISYGDSDNWISHNFYTYVLFRPGVDVTDFCGRMRADVLKKYVGPQVKQFLGITAQDFFAAGGELNYFFQPLTDIHLDSHLEKELEPNGHAVYVYLFSVIALAILLIAGVNFVNLATARATDRAREVGVRKSIGSRRDQLVGQFLCEALLLSSLAVLLALPLVHLVLPWFNRLAGKTLLVPYLDNPVFIPFLVGLALIVGLLAGLYPAFRLSAFRPVSVLRGGTSGEGSSSRLRGVLVVFQFAVSLVLIVGTLVVYSQLAFIQDRNLGFDREQIVVVRKANDLGGNLVPFMNEVAALPDIAAVSNSSDIPGEDLGDTLYRPLDRPADHLKLIRNLWVDPSFAEAYGMQMVDGRFFIRSDQDTVQAVVINETAARNLELDAAVGEQLISMEGKTYSVVGVIRDFHFESLHQPIRPMLFRLMRPAGGGKYVSVRLDSAGIRETLPRLENLWRKQASGQAFEYEFFDDHFARVFLAEERTGQVFLVFSVLAVGIASLGLLGLAAFITRQRTREIGIRRVLGASTREIWWLFLRLFGRWLALAALIGIPLSWWVMDRWLEDFAYRTRLGVEVFGASLLLVVLVALVTVSLQILRAARVKPVDTLRCE